MKIFMHSIVFIYKMRFFVSTGISFPNFFVIDIDSLLVID